MRNKGKEKPEIPGCKEKLDKEFLFYVLNYNKNKRKYIVENLENIDKKKLLVFKSRKMLNNWLKNIK